MRPGAQGLPQRAEVRLDHGRRLPLPEHAAAPTYAVEAPGVARSALPFVASPRSRPLPLSDAEPLDAMLARIAANPPPPTRYLVRTYVGRSQVEPPPRGVSGDLAEALATIPNRRSRLRGER